MPDKAFYLNACQREAAGVADTARKGLDAPITSEQPIYTWFPSDQTARFWMRRMAQETAVHRWDAELAQSDPRPIEGELARDGIDETLDVMVPMRRQWQEPRRGEGERYHFHRTDGPGEWLVVFDGDNPRVSHEHARGDVALRGSASDLLLWLWRRIPSDRLEAMGDTTLLNRWFELVPPD